MELKEWRTEVELVGLRSTVEPERLSTWRVKGQRTARGPKVHSGAKGLTDQGGVSMLKDPGGARRLTDHGGVKNSENHRIRGPRQRWQRVVTLYVSTLKNAVALAGQETLVAPVEPKDWRKPGGQECGAACQMDIPDY